MSLLMEALKRAENANKRNSDSDELGIRLVDNVTQEPSLLQTPPLNAFANDPVAQEFTSVVINSTPKAPDAPDSAQDRESAKKLVHASNKRYGRSFKSAIVVVCTLVMITLASALVILEQRVEVPLVSLSTAVSDNLVSPEAAAVDNVAVQNITPETPVTETFAPEALVTDTPVTETLVTETIAPEAFADDTVATETVAINTTTVVTSAPIAQAINRATDITITRSTDTQSIRPLAERAALLISARQYPQAAELLQQILGMQPSNLQALMLYGSLELNAGNLGNASALFSRVIAIDPGNVSARVGFLKSIPGMPTAELITELNRLLQTARNNHLLAFELGRAYSSESRWTEATRSFRSALELVRSSNTNNQVIPEYAFNLAVSLDRSGDRTQAVRYYNEALDSAGLQATAFDPAVVRARVSVLSGR